MIRERECKDTGHGNQGRVAKHYTEHDDGRPMPFARVSRRNPRRGLLYFLFPPRLVISTVTSSSLLAWSSSVTRSVIVCEPIPRFTETVLPVAI